MSDRRLRYFEFWRRDPRRECGSRLGVIPRAAQPGSRVASPRYGPVAVGAIAEGARVSPKFPSITGG